MNPLLPADLSAFTRRYRLAGGRLKRVKIRYGQGDQFTVEFTLAARPIIRDLGTQPPLVHLRFRLTGVEEFRFQKRPNTATGTVAEARIGHFQSLFFVNLDAWTLGPGEVPRLHDFRASDTYIAGRELFWTELEPRPRS